MRLARLCALVSIGLFGCTSSQRTGDEPMDAATGHEPDRHGAATQSAYALAELPMRFGDVPYPDDAYLDDAGHVSVRDIPSSASAAYRIALADALRELDGFGARPTIYVRFDGAIDPDSLPVDAAASLEPEASVFLVDADTSSPHAFERIPVEVSYAAALRELRIVPAYGRPLAAGRRYAAIVTTGLRDVQGEQVGPADPLARILDADRVLDDPAERAARARYEPVLAALSARSLPRGSVASIAVFTVQSAGSELAEAREWLYRMPPPRIGIDRVVLGAELDDVLGTPPEGAAGLDDGAPHDQVGLLAHAHVELPSLISPQPGVHGAIARDADGALIVRSRGARPFSIFLPRNVSPSAPMPLLVVLHDEGAERSDASAVANALCGRGYVVVAPDAPFHGLRDGGADERSRFTGADRPDGFGDAPGDFEGFADTQGPLPAGHPSYYRDAVRQAAVDTLGLLRVLREADFDALAAISPELSAARLQSSRIGLLGIGLGAEVALLVSPLEPAVDAVVVAFPGGVGVDGWLEAPASRALADALLQRLGRSYDSIDWLRDPPSTWPDIDAFRAIADRGSALAQAAAFRRSPTNLLVLMARDDERAPNARTEALAAALGARLALEGATIDPELPSDELVSGDTVRGNVSLEAGDLTRSLVVLEPATHEALTLQHGERAFDPPLVAPFSARESPERVRNPTAAVLMQVAYFFESLRGCTPADRSPCSATALVP